MIRFKHTISEAGLKLHIQDGKSFLDFPAQYSRVSQRSIEGLTDIKELKIAGCKIDDFSFLGTMPNLEKLYLLDCDSQVWDTLQGTPAIVSLGLHNLKQGKKYLDTTCFLSTFPHLEYLLTAILGVGRMPELAGLKKLHTVFGEFRNENDKKLPHDFSPFRDAESLKIFDGWMSADRHRVPAQSFIPIIENPALESFTYTQMYTTEDKQVARLIEELHPSLTKTALTFQQLMFIRANKFAD